MGQVAGAGAREFFAKRGGRADQDNRKAGTDCGNRALNDFARGIVTTEGVNGDGEW